MNSVSDSVAAGWVSAAACAGLGRRADIFFATDGDTQTLNAARREARAICGGCPSRVPCLTAAYRDDEEYGIRGGLTRKQRIRFLRENGGDVGRAVADATGGGALVRRIFDARTEPVDGGHVLWPHAGGLVYTPTGVYTVHQFAWLVHYGGPPDGSVMRVCDREGCVARECLADRTMRGRRPS